MDQWRAERRLSCSEKSTFSALGSEVLHNAPSTGALDLAATQPCPEARIEAVNANRKSNEVPSFEHCMKCLPEGAMIVGARELADNNVLVLTSEDLRFVFLKTHD